MPRNAEEHRRRAVKCCRRHRLLHGMGSQAELRRSTVPREEARRLIATLDVHRDVTHRSAAVVDALEGAER